MRHGVVSGQIRGIHTERYIALFKVQINVRPHKIIGTFGGRGFHKCLICGLDVEATEALQPCVGDDRD